MLLQGDFLITKLICQESVEKIQLEIDDIATIILTYPICVEGEFILKIQWIPHMKQVLVIGNQYIRQGVHHTQYRVFMIEIAGNHDPKGTELQPSSPSDCHFHREIIIIPYFFDVIAIPEDFRFIGSTRICKILPLNGKPRFLARRFNHDIENLLPFKSHLVTYGQFQRLGTFHHGFGPQGNPTVLAGNDCYRLTS
ncbi:hypothetical protein SDC9_175255 [bioreactor metagenome]|uniref:Uncharacterized protein n=1 Tax=bioreactor metagenome TaxID=1076179 RepID=A0A645GLJ6_9ZZZZ